MQGEVRDYSGLIREAKVRLASCAPTDSFLTGIPQAERMLGDVDKFGHHFVLACLMDRQISAKEAWAIPYKIGLRAGGFEFRYYERLGLNDLVCVFGDERLHRFRAKRMPEIFFDGIRRIASVYGGDAKRIWSDNPSCALVVRRFLEFNGVGPKIASMATNILVRQFKIPMHDKSAIDISADRQVMKFFQARGLLREGAKKEEAIYLAREIYPQYPGLLDLLAWEAGQQL